jgi:hypothetical protein
MERGAATDPVEEVGAEGLLDVQPVATTSETRRPRGNVRLM